MNLHIGYAAAAAPAPPPVREVPTVYASTLLTTSSWAGSNILKVDSLDYFQVDQEIVIDYGTSREEDNVIKKFGSLVLMKPLKFNHDAGAKVWAISEAKALDNVMHDKHPGGGYKRGSPLYEKQKAMKSTVAKTPVSTAMKCIIFLLAQFFIVHTTLVVAQVMNRARPGSLKRLEDCLKLVTDTVYMIPMLCVLFLAVRMRAIQLSQGMTEQYDLPQWWVKSAMITCVVAHMFRTIIYAVYSAMYNKDPKGNRSHLVTGREKGFIYAIYAVTAIHHIGFVFVCAGLWTMQPPQELVGPNGVQGSAIFCTILLATLFFAVHFCIDLVKTLGELATPGKRFSVATSTTLFRNLHHSVDTIPMMCILFLTARLRGFQLTPTAPLASGTPLHIAEIFYYVATWSMVALVLLNVIASVMLRREETRDDAESPTEMAPVLRLSRAAKIFNVLRSLFVVAINLSGIVIVISVLIQKRKDGPTPILPSSMQCILVLAGLYFLFHATMFTTYLVKRSILGGQRAGEDPSARKSREEKLDRALRFLETRTQEVIEFIPVLSVLFLGTFLRALQITAGKGAPPMWAQDWMYLATVSVIFLTVARVDELLFDDHSKAAEKGVASRPSKAVIFFEVLQIGSLLLMHVAVIGIIYAIFTMTARSARGRGSISTVF
jgi:preprotein translocase subunit SecG